MSNITRLSLSRWQGTSSPSLFQYDYGQRIIFTNGDLPEAYEVHFSNEKNGESITMIGDSTGVDIPDELLLTGDPLYVWLYLHTGESDGETKYDYVINIIKRAKITNAEPTPVQQDVITQTIAALNTAVGEVEVTAGEVEQIAEQIPQTINSALQEAYDSGMFKGDKGDKGDRGDTGPRGNQGEQGEKGEQGDVGPAGPKGDPFTYADFTPEQLASLRGPQGEQGPVGPQGEQGPKGDPFVYSDFTPEQLATLTGPRGEQGIQGEKGDPGEKGDTGSKGDPFVYSDFTPEQLAALTGPRGEQGIQGEKGDPGEKGETGEQGIQGEAGPTGVGISSTVLNQDYTLTITLTNGNSYTTSSIRGSQGEQGIQGIQGVQGEKGDPFTVKKTFASISEMNNYSGSDVVEGDFVVISSNVEDPDNGKLYLKAANGYTFITDLSGAQGMKGDTGAKGEQGVQGETGATGQDGYSPSASVNKSGSTTTISITDKTGTTTAQVTDGINGVSPSASVSKSGSTATVSITDVSGTTTAQISDGYTPVKGTDYWTQNDQAAILADTESYADDLIAVQSSQPTTPQTKIWIPTAASSTTQVPTYTEHTALAEQVNTKQDDLCLSIVNGEICITYEEVSS